MPPFLLTSRILVEPYTTAAYYARLGNHEQMLYWLERAYESRAFALPLAKSNPVFADLSRTARFQDVLQRMKLLPAAY